MKPVTQKRLRSLHNYLGVLFAPGILLFSVSGIFQILGLHESEPGRLPAAPFIGLLASMHKEGDLVPPKRRPPPPPLVAKPPKDNAVTFAPFKIYALLLSTSLIVSTVLGILVALANCTARSRTWALLVAGCVIPLLLLLV